VRAERFAQLVHLRVPGYRPADDWFDLPAGRTRRIALRGDGTAALTDDRAAVRALNARHAVMIETAGSAETLREP
jgi:hypothetical protein